MIFRWIMDGTLVQSVQSLAMLQSADNDEWPVSCTWDGIIIILMQFFLVVQSTATKQAFNLPSLRLSVCVSAQGRAHSAKKSYCGRAGATSVACGEAQILLRRLPRNFPVTYVIWEV